MAYTKAFVDDLDQALMQMMEDPYEDSYDEEVKRFLKDCGVAMPSIDDNIFSDEAIRMYNNLVDDFPKF